MPYETSPTRIGAVVIGRNEGARLELCLRSLGGLARLVYVDSGSTDDSVAAARALGAEVVALDTDIPFTAARARNAGLARLTEGGEPPDLVQFVDGDCEVQPGWIAEAAAFLAVRPEVAVVCGRRRERFPEATLYNRLTDMEWDTPVGEARACGGDALMRRAALAAVGGYNPALIAGEEPELCVRLRLAGWKIWRLDAEMTLHDAAITRFGQWWKRTRRAGHAYAQGAALHGKGPTRHNVAQTRRALLWGAALPLLTLLAGALSPWGWLLLLVWPLQVLRLMRQGRPAAQAVFLTLGKIPEALGAAEFYLSRARGRQNRLIEYK
ncbi:glycosyltransferase family 2 protein [Poseidonocella sedimentorum]|uniref:Glycosyltransferase, GT2 family n=1 Tax=Poseidonocella sedimentorum TaxID=871652 RepID=A0A1I6ENA8_9RHOB|nr:glycosyltransferase family 2 protein [Poseidonocella sedimentorum]SFR19234.1 Glycosyltransferase, GT2 family [Poseidonocella sedimentorum]